MVIAADAYVPTSGNWVGGSEIDAALKAPPAWRDFSPRRCECIRSWWRPCDGECRVVLSSAVGSLPELPQDMSLLRSRSETTLGCGAADRAVVEARMRSRIASIVTGVQVDRTRALCLNFTTRSRTPCCSPAVLPRMSCRYRRGD